MRRITTVLSRSVILAAAFAAMPGCSWFGGRRVAGDPSVVPEPQLRKLQREDRARLAGEDGPGTESHFVYGVDIGRDHWYYAPFHLIGGATLRLIEFIDGERPVKYATAMEDTRSPDRRREAILKTASYRFARKDPYTRRYAQISQEGGLDPTVKSASLRALNRSRDKSAVDLYLRMLDNTEPGVRLEAAKALGNIPADKAVTPLVQHLANDDNKDVRIACADALREYKTLDVSRALINVLGDRDFAISWQARQSLKLMTGRDYRYNDVAWLDFFSRVKSPFI